MPPEASTGPPELGAHCWSVPRNMAVSLVAEHQRDAHRWHGPRETAWTMLGEQSPRLRSGVMGGGTSQRMWGRKLGERPAGSHHCARLRIWGTEESRRGPQPSQWRTPAGGSRAAAWGAARAPRAFCPPPALSGPFKVRPRSDLEAGCLDPGPPESQDFPKTSVR